MSPESCRLAVLGRGDLCPAIPHGLRVGRSLGLAAAEELWRWQFQGFRRFRAEQHSSQGAIQRRHSNDGHFLSWYIAGIQYAPSHAARYTSIFILCILLSRTRQFMSAGPDNCEVAR